MNVIIVKLWDYYYTLLLYGPRLQLDFGVKTTTTTTTT